MNQIQVMKLILFPDILFPSIDDLITLSFGNDPAMPTHRVRLAIYHDDLEKPIGFPYTRRQDMTTELVMAKFIQLSQMLI